jgi:N-acetylglucosaminyldiphosphoundecaprenol N-acetyl-beta-D-mannosaminyltransferase
MTLCFLRKDFLMKLTSESFPNLEVHLLNRRITYMTIPGVLEAVLRSCKENRKITVSSYTINSFNHSMLSPWFYEFQQQADITLCDSMGMLGAIRSMGLKLPIDYRVSYTLLMPKLFEMANRHSLSVFLLGARQKDLQAALQRQKERYPHIHFMGHHGYFSPEDKEQSTTVIDRINHAKPQILIVGMGCPIQEKWLHLNQQKLDVNTIMSGGAVIDRLAGVVPDCPTLLSDMSLEWLYRLYQEPQRMANRYLLGNPAFLLLIMLAKSSLTSAELLKFQPLSISDVVLKHSQQSCLAPRTFFKNWASTIGRSRIKLVSSPPKRTR